MANDIKTTRCVRCAGEFSDEETKGKSACPRCGDHGVPCSISEDVALRINWHELRILTMWATNWTGTDGFPESSRGALTAIIARLEKQRPENAAPLTLAGEIRELQETMPSVSLTDGNGRVIVPPKKTQ